MINYDYISNLFQKDNDIELEKIIDTDNINFFKLDDYLISNVLFAVDNRALKILKLLKIFYINSRIGIVINDLQRSAIAYRLFQLVCVVFRLEKMTREDGLTSILRGFKKKELVEFSEELKFKKYKINWRWAFRYQWIISKR